MTSTDNISDDEVVNIWLEHHHLLVLTTQSVHVFTPDSESSRGDEKLMLLHQIMEHLYS